MPSPTYVQGATGMQKGVKNAETGSAVESIDWTINDPVEYSQDRVGGNSGFCHGFNPSVELEISGEISNEESGICLAQYGTAITFANETNCLLTDTDSTFANVANTGGFYPTAISFSESRDGFRTMSITTISHPDIT